MKILKQKAVVALAATVALVSCQKKVQYTIDDVNGMDERITFIGRIDRSNDMPRMYTSGSYFSFAFTGRGCEIYTDDENLYGTNYNYYEIIVDDLEPIRVATVGVKNTIVLGRVQSSRAADTTDINVISVLEDLPEGRHTVEIVRDTETGMGYTTIRGLSTTNLEQWTRPTDLRIEFIGNSITCGAESYLDEVPYGEGTWFDRHRAYYAYGPRTARALNAQWALTSVSGIGLIHSCCDMTVTMPMVYDKIALSTNQIAYDFSFVPDVVCVCLGQNDGIQDSTAFCSAYVDFVHMLRSHYPEAHIAMLSSPMADDELRAWMQRMLPAIEEAAADSRLSHFFFSRSWNSGGGTHPDMAEHEQIADELTAYLRSIL